MISLCMMDNSGEWAVSQEFFSTAEASDKRKTVAGLVVGTVYRNII